MDNEMNEEALKYLSPEEYNDLFPKIDGVDIEKLVAPIWERYYKAKTSGTLEDEIDDIKTSFR